MIYKSLLALGTAAVISTALFHTALKSSIPAKDSTGPSPAVISLTFTEAVKGVASGISILKPDSTEVAKLVVATTKDPATVEAKVAKPLAAGKYLVRWRTVSDDGHAVKGTFAFTVTAK